MVRGFCACCVMAASHSRPLPHALEISCSIPHVVSTQPSPATHTHTHTRTHTHTHTHTQSLSLSCPLTISCWVEQVAKENVDKAMMLPAAFESDQVANARVRFVTAGHARAHRTRLTRRLIAIYNRTTRRVKPRVWRLYVSATRP